MLNDFIGADKVYIACGYTDLRCGIDGLANIVQQQFQLDPLYQYAVSLLRQAERPHQSTLLGEQWICSAIQATGKRGFSVAAQRSGSKRTDTAAVPLAYGRTANRPTQGTQGGNGVECCIKCRIFCGHIPSMQC